MRTTLIFGLPFLAITAAQSTGKLGDAAVVTNNPAGATYKATLPEKSSTKVRGFVTISSGAGGKGASYVINLTGLPTSGGPFMYHVHDQPVPFDGNCTKTLAHFDPYLRGEDTSCNSTAPATCQVGDLSGKYGKFNGTSYTATYTDPYTDLVPCTSGFIGNRSLVVHFANKTRISCANFEPVISLMYSPDDSACQDEDDD